MKKEKILEKLFNSKNISIEEAEHIFSLIFNNEVDHSEVSAILVALRLKGETFEEIAGAIKVLDSLKLNFKRDITPVVDTCGTGGDGKNCFNVSTAVALTVSSDGIPVVKHGNSAQSGLVGSADILEQLQIPVKISDTNKANSYLNEKKFIFLFAPMFHPCMKNVAPIRKKLKVPTIFNFIGPFINPANPEFQVTGIGNREKIKDIIKALKLIGRKNIILYSSRDGYDEISSFAPTDCYEINEEVEQFTINPENFFEPFKMPVVKSSKEAIECFLDAISGKNDNLAKIVALNSLLIFKKFKKLDSLKESFEYGYEILKSGKVLNHFERLKDDVA